MKRPALIWLALVVPLWLLFVLGTHWEPIMRDGWGHWTWHRNVGLSLEHLYDFAKGTYVHNNPRLGQVLTMIVYTPGPWHSIITPLVELGMFILLAALMLGRWPSWRSSRDALLVATIVAIVFACGRSLGPMLFYRPFTGNYVFGLVINLAWLIPYRFHAEAPRKRPLWWIPMMLVLGAAAGLSNEHTGPAFIAAATVALVVYWRRGERFVPWALAGWLAANAGMVALLLAPGQAYRYNGLATQQSTLERILDRGASGNGRILVLLLIYMLPALVWFVLAMVARIRNRERERLQSYAPIIALGTALLIVLTLFASPKQGDRLYFAPICLASAAIAYWVIAQLGRSERIIAVAFAVIAIGYVSFRLITTYHTAHAEFAARMATLERAQPGSVVTVREYSQRRSRWVLGDDFKVPTLRANVAFQLGLGGIEWIQREDTAVPPPVVPDAP